VPKPYQEFPDVFAKQSFDEFTDWKKWDHTIYLSQTLKHSVPPWPWLSRSSWTNSLMRTSKSNVHPSNSPIASLVFFFKKMDGSLCLIQEYWKLNAMTVKNS